MNHESRKIFFRVGRYRPACLICETQPLQAEKSRPRGKNPADVDAYAPMLDAVKALNEMQCNWAHLAYDRGQPQEQSSKAWADFNQAAELFHHAGSPVLARIGLSSCAYAGSNKNKNWYALDATGRKIAAAPGYYRVDWSSAEWMLRLQALIKGALTRGADGFIFDDIQHGAKPQWRNGAWRGSAGCHCPRCQQHYQQQKNSHIPASINLEDEAVRVYLDWRAEQLSDHLKILCDYVRLLKPQAVINLCLPNPIHQPLYLACGVDLHALAEHGDVFLFENPAWQQTAATFDVDRVVLHKFLPSLIKRRAHAAVLTAKRQMADKPAINLRKDEQEIYAASACGISTALRCIQRDANAQVLPIYHPAMAALKAVYADCNRWLLNQQACFAVQDDVSPIGVFFDDQTVWATWQQRLARLMKTAYVLTAGACAWRIIRPGDAGKGLKTLICLDGHDSAAVKNFNHLKIIHLDQLTGWQEEKPPEPSFQTMLTRLFQRHKYTPTDMAALVGNMRGEAAQISLMKAVSDVYPRITAEAAVLAKLWKAQAGHMLHMVNLSEEAQIVSVEFSHAVSCRIITPSENTTQPFQGQLLRFNLDQYVIVKIKGRL